ncbi:MAG TPA: hypothetical protein VMV01_06755 [Planctomycetota bacterium]|nr:hypothetical protein [Planctomycetota bacterium]
MTSHTERAALRRLLAALDEGPQQARRALARRPRTGRLFGLLARARLDTDELLLLLVALAARVSGRELLSGEELIARGGGDSATRLDALAALTAPGRLLGCGLLLADAPPADGAQALLATYRLADHVLALACEALRPVPTAARPRPTPYVSNAELLADLRRLALLYQRRAARVFQIEPWAAGAADAAPANELLARAREQAAAVEARLALTAASEPLPLLRLLREHALDLDAAVILVTLLFQELIEGVGAVDAVDLVKLVSESEEEVLRRRMLLRPLQRRHLIRLDGAYSGKDLTADASLPNEVVERMLGSGAPIGSDERIDFHSYLANLQSSDPFFSDLDPGSPDEE